MYLETPWDRTFKQRLSDFSPLNEQISTILNSILAFSKIIHFLISSDFEDFLTKCSKITKKERFCKFKIFKIKVEQKWASKILLFVVIIEHFVVNTSKSEKIKKRIIFENAKIDSQNV